MYLLAPLLSGLGWRSLALMSLSHQLLVSFLFACLLIATCLLVLLLNTKMIMFHVVAFCFRSMPLAVKHFVWIPSCWLTVHPYCALVDEVGFHILLGFYSNSAFILESGLCREARVAGAFWDSCADRVHISFDVAVACASVSRSCLSQNGPVTVTRKVHSCCCSWQEKRRAGRSAAIEKIRQNRTRVGSVGPCSFLKWCWMLQCTMSRCIPWTNRVLLGDLIEKGLNGMRQRQDREQEKELEALKKEDGYAAWKQRFNEVISCQKHWCWDSKTD